MSKEPGWVVAVDRASTLVGNEIVSVLKERKFPVSELRLLGDSDEARETGESPEEESGVSGRAADSFKGVDLAILVDHQDDWPDIRGVRFPPIVVNSAAAPSKGSLYAVPTWEEKRDYERAKRVVIPHPASALLATLSRAVSTISQVEELFATILIPSSERGAAGITELHEQTLGLLNFRDVPTTVFGQQQCFNITPYGSATEAGEFESRIQLELTKLVGKKPAPSITVLEAGVFHGLSVSVFVRASGISEDDLRAALDQGGIHPGEPGVASGEPVSSPVRSAGKDEFYLGRVHAAGKRDCFGIWLVADGLRIVALSAVRVAEELTLST